jgi:hypothetical protein
MNPTNNPVAMGALPSNSLTVMDWYTYNHMYIQGRPKIHTRLTADAIHKILKNQPVKEFDEKPEYIMQIILIKFAETTSSMKARLMVSDGQQAAVAVLHTAIYEKLNLQYNQELKQFDIIRVRKCVAKQVGKKDNPQSMLIFAEPIELLYSGLTKKIGTPKEVNWNQTQYDKMCKVPSN